MSLVEQFYYHPLRSSPPTHQDQQQEQQQQEQEQQPIKLHSNQLDPFQSHSPLSSSQYSINLSSNQTSSQSNTSTPTDLSYHHHHHHHSNPIIPSSDAIWIQFSPQTSFYQSSPTRFQSDSPTSINLNHSIQSHHHHHHQNPHHPHSTSIDSHPQPTLNTDPNQSSFDLLSNSTLETIKDHKPNSISNSTHSIIHNPISESTHSINHNPISESTHSIIHNPISNSTHSIIHNPISHSTHSINHNPIPNSTHSIIHNPISESTHSIIHNPSWNQLEPIQSTEPSKPLSNHLISTSPPSISNEVQPSNSSFDFQTQPQSKSIDQSFNPNAHHHHPIEPLPISSSPPFQLQPHLVHLADPSNRLSQPISTGLNQSILEESGHNAVEKRYRNNINSHIAALADLVPALQHLRALPSAATSRRHSSQFIVSTSAIGKIPSGLVDGVKAATKLSKGNILSKSVDYVKHLLRTRVEMEEDLNELKEMIRLRVEGGELLILEWEEKMNLKINEREKKRMMEQNQLEDEVDDEIEVSRNESSIKKRKVLNPIDSVQVTKPKPNHPKSNKSNQKKITNPSVPFTLSLDSNSNQTHHLISPPIRSDGSNPNHHSTLSFDQSNQLEELNIYKQPEPIPRHSKFNSTYQPTHDFLHQTFINPFQSTLSDLPPSNLLAISMGFSFAMGSVYHYYQTKSLITPLSDSSNPSEPTPHLRTYPNSCFDDQIRFGTLELDHLGLMKAGIQTVSIASMIFVLLILFKPEFLLNFIQTSYPIKPSSSFKKTQNFKTKDLMEEEKDQDQSLKRKVKLPIGVLGFGIECFKVSSQLPILLGLPQWFNCSSWVDDQEDQTDQVKRWSKIAETEILNQPSEMNFLNRLYIALKLYNLIDWKIINSRREIQQIEDLIKSIIILSIYLRDLLGQQNLISQTLWNLAKESLTLIQPSESSRMIYKDEIQMNPNLNLKKHQIKFEIQEILKFSFEEIHELLETSKSDSSYRLMSINYEAHQADCNLIQKILEIKFEIDLIEIWSRIFVSTIKKTTPIQSRTSELPQSFELHSINQLPTRLEEAGDHYALQVSNGRMKVRESMERMSEFLASLEADSKTEGLNQMVNLTKGVWSLAFDDERVSELVGEGLRKELEGEEEEDGLESVESYVELMMMKKKMKKKDGRERDGKKKKKAKGRRSGSTLDGLASLTIQWLMIREMYLIRIVLPHQRWSLTRPELIEFDQRLEIRERGMGLRERRREFERQMNLNLIEISTKQSTESIQNGESEEYDLRMSLMDLEESIEKLMEECMNL
ncbi:hypothetical protein DFH28DRAFT_111748 [Melampsora americana]|nr:hypothetical protein DFH28DRAFT_111748 [Melampsora americana]